MNTKDSRNVYAPWEMEEDVNKKKAERKGIPTQNRRAVLHSKPRVKDHDFLEMYILSREKERLEKYGRTLGRRVKLIALSWMDAKTKMYKLYKTTARVNKKGIKDLSGSEQKKNKKPAKTQKKTQKMDWDY